MGHWTYLAILVGTLLAAAWLQLLPGVNVFGQPRRWLLSLLPGTAFLVWDIVVAERGWWAFAEQYTLGPRLLGLPLEEIAFFLVVPTCAILGYEAVRAVLAARR